jgi:hypothetical protein
MPQNQTPLTAWVVGDPHTGGVTLTPNAQDSFGAQAQMDCTLIGKMQHLLAGLVRASQGTGFMSEFPGPALGNGLH